jgi:AP-4 complex subunit mu-1
MISQLFILSARGDTLIVKDFRSDHTKNVPETFYRIVKMSKHDPDPIFNKDGINYIFVKQSSLFIVATTRFNSTPSTCIDLLNVIIKNIKDFCGVFTEEAIRKNFVLIYELIDEMVDFGYPQLSQIKQVKELIVSEVSMCQNVKPAKSNIGIWTFNTVGATATQKSITSKNSNEIYVDGIERINVVFNSSGCVINSSIDGSIQMKSYLSGEPILKLCLCDDVITKESQTFGIQLENYSFNKCVDDKDFEMNRTLVIRPPAGEFVAMNYKISQNFLYPFKIYPFMSEISNYKIEFLIKISSTFSTESTASKVNIKFSVPKSSSSVKLDLPKDKDIKKFQKAEYDDSEKSVNWEILKFKGQKQHSLVAVITLKEELNSYQIRKELGPIKLNFEVNNYMASSLFIKYLRIENHGEKKPPQRWLRYITQSNSYISRV